MAGGSKSKNKGSAYERDLCRFLGETFGGTFIRSTNSGAFLGGKNAGRKAGLSQTQIAGQKGDVVPPEHMPKLVIEAKAYKAFRFHQLLMQGTCGQLDEWILQSREACDPGDLSLIIFKVDRLGSFLYGSFDSFEPEVTQDLNHARYESSAGEVGFITEMKPFLARNRQAILRLSA